MSPPQTNHFLLSKIQGVWNPRDRPQVIKVEQQQGVMSYNKARAEEIAMEALAARLKELHYGVIGGSYTSSVPQVLEQLRTNALCL